MSHYQCHKCLTKYHEDAMPSYCSACHSKMVTDLRAERDRYASLLGKYRAAVEDAAESKEAA
jgi:cbb3-type cytochrome oxidase cytochrome c subunit